MIDTTLIQGALLAMQQQKDARFCSRFSDKSNRMGWWWKTYVADTFQMEVMVYISKASPTGYAVQIDYLDDEAMTILDRPLQNFEEFDALFDRKFMAVAFRDWKKSKK